jgi:hypothetical protein
MEHTLDTTSGRSFIKAANRTGPRTLPCGTLLRTEVQSGTVPLILTRCRLPAEKSLIHVSTLLSILKDFNLRNSRSCGTLSNALTKSNYTTSTGSLSSSRRGHLSRVDKRLVVQDLPAIKPRWQSDRRLLAVNWSINRSLATDSITMQTTLVKLTGR